MSQTYYRPQPFEDRTPCAECGDRYRKVGLLRGVEYCEKCLPTLLDRARETSEVKEATRKAHWDWQKALYAYSGSLRKEGISDEERRQRVREWKRDNPEPKQPHS